ncbi:hypothetical protein CHARACLAT_017454 [Characodon lateralis]|uniref:Uncharacterized protein n=1 Tax=Characodon lateralis TaxID=208331 RepID=A0ABU7CSH7_9TELE|nr:hypothetical protein [Characodon lateralis]
MHRKMVHADAIAEYNITVSAVTQSAKLLPSRHAGKKKKKTELWQSLPDTEGKKRVLRHVQRSLLRRVSPLFI